MERSDGLTIAASGITKSYAGRPVLAGVDLAVPRGTIFALLGPNGAGKTTTVRILSTLLAADGGQASVAGFDVVRQRSEVRRRVSLTGQEVALDELQTGVENLRMIGRLAGLSRTTAQTRADELLHRVDLADAAKRRVVTYSGGMRRRLDVAASLVARPEVIFLDEPTTGLDLRSRHATWALLEELSASAVTIFLTTQYLEEADRLADSIAVMNDGRIVAEGTSAQLKQRVSQHRLEVTIPDRGALERVASVLDSRALRVDRDRREIGIGTDGSAAHVRALLDEIDPDRTAVAAFDVHTTTLDDVFLSLTEAAHV